MYCVPVYSNVDRQSRAKGTAQTDVAALTGLLRLVVEEVAEVARRLPALAAVGAGGGVAVVAVERGEERVDDLLVRLVPRDLVGPRHPHHLRQVEVRVRERQQRQVVLARSEPRGEDVAVESARRLQVHLVAGVLVQEVEHVVHAALSTKISLPP